MRTVVLLLVIPLLGSMGLASASAVPLPLVGPMDPTPRAPNAIQVAYEFELLPALDGFALSGHFRVREVAVAGQGVSAQAIRDGSDVARQEFEREFKAVVSRELAAAFIESKPVGTTLSFAYGASDLDADPYDPPIDVTMTARIPLTASLLGLHSAKFTEGSELAKAFLYSGGRAVIDRTIPVPAGFNTDFQVTVPEFLRISTIRDANATSISFPNDNTRGGADSQVRLLFALGLRAESIPENVLRGPTVRATFIAHDDTTLWMKALPWTSGEYSADLDLWIEVPSISAGYFGASPLPPNLKTSQYSADLVRVAVRERLVTAEDVHSFFAVLIEEGLREGFGESASIEMDKAAFRESVARPIGGVDGKTVEPLMIHAKAKLPLRADKMVMGSSVAQTLGTITGIPARFPVSNDGAWMLDLTLLYPEGVTVTVHDSAGFAEKVYAQERQGVHVLLAPGQKTDVTVHGRPGMDAAILAIGLLEIGMLTAGLVWLVFRVRRIGVTKRPWGPRP